MEDLNPTLTALLLGLGSGVTHPWGHVAAGGSVGIPVNVNYQTLSEWWPGLRSADNSVDPTTPNTQIQRPMLGNEKRFSNQAETFGGGLSLQDDLAGAAQGTSGSREQDLANALYKLWYLFGIPGGAGRAYGDVSRMAAFSGNPMTRQLLGASALNQLFKGVTGKKPIAGWPDSIDFSTFGVGTPGLKANWRF